MEKFDQPELHPRGFPLWIEILLVAALILTPIIAVALYQAYQDSQQKPDGAVTQPAVTQPAVTETETKTETAPTKSVPEANTESTTEVKTDGDTKAPTEKPSN